MVDPKPIFAPGVDLRELYVQSREHGDGHRSLSIGFYSYDGSYNACGFTTTPDIDFDEMCRNIGRTLFDLCKEGYS